MSDRERIFRPTKGLNPHYAKEFLEVREGDPKDLDTLLDIVDSIIEAWRETDNRFAIFDTAAALASLEAARHGERGKG